MDFVVPFFRGYFHGSSLIFMLLYLWSKRNPNAPISLFGIMQLQAGWRGVRPGRQPRAQALLRASSRRGCQGHGSSWPGPCRLLLGSQLPLGSEPRV